MSQPQQMNPGGMGGPVGGAMPGQPQMNAPTPTNSGTLNHSGLDHKTGLNTYIYDYFLRTQHYDIARVLFQHSDQLQIKTENKQSPKNQANGVDDVDNDRPKDLPEAAISSSEGPFLQDWWHQFWDIYNGRRSIGNSKPTMVNYLAQQRQNQKLRGSMMGNMDPSMQQNMRNMSMMNNGMMPNDLKKAAMQNAGNMNPAQVAQMQRMRQQQGQQPMMPGQQMERSNSQMEMNGPRSNSPGSGDAPSPKRPRLEGNMQQQLQRPGPQGQMSNQVGPDSPPLDPAAAQHTRELLGSYGIDTSTMPEDQIQMIASQPTNNTIKSLDVYSRQMQRTMTNAMNNANSDTQKGMPPNVAAAMGPTGSQGSPMSQAGIDGAMADFNGGMRPGMVPNPAVAAAGPQAGQNNGNHALQDYQMQLMLLEQQNKKRLLMARQEQDSMTQPGMPPGTHAQFAPNMSPQGSRAGGPSPNPNDMSRGTPKMQPGTSPNGQMQGRGSPAPGGFDPNSVPPNMRGMMMGPNGQMLPRSHPQQQFPGGNQLTQGQLEMFNRQSGQMMPNGTFPGGPQQMPPGMMPGQPGPGQQPGQIPPNMTPRQGNQAMPPPPAPQPNQTGGTQPSSPAPSAAPPTPSQANKSKPGKKNDAKNNKKGANKKGNQPGATPASESEQPPTPTPATPITPMHPNSFQKNGQQPGGMPNGAPQQPPQPGQQPQQGPGAGAVQQQQQQPQPPPMQDMQPFGNLGDPSGFGGGVGDMSLEFGNLAGDDVLDNFDFDSFLNNGDDGGMNFDNFAFEGLEAGGDVMPQ